MRSNIISLCIIFSIFLPISSIGLYEQNENISQNILLLNNCNPQQLLFIDDTIDQNQSSTCGESISLSNSSWIYAQSFKPSMNLLTKISLFMGKKGNIPNSTFTLSLRKYLHSDLFKEEINISLIENNGNWIEWEFEAVTVNLNESYYIVCQVPYSSEDDYIEWFFDINDPYTAGKPSYCEGNGKWKDFQLDSPYQDIDLCFKTYGINNSKPEIPIKPDGPDNGQYGKEYTFQTRSFDADDNQLYYKWSWGDGELSEWIGPYRSEEISTASHVWLLKGSYLIKVKVKDHWGFESNWSEPFTIRMEKNRVSSIIQKWFIQFNTIINV